MVVTDRNIITVVVYTQPRYLVRRIKIALMPSQRRTLILAAEAPPPRAASSAAILLNTTSNKNNQTSNGRTHVVSPQGSVRTQCQSVGVCTITNQAGRSSVSVIHRTHRTRLTTDIAYWSVTLMVTAVPAPSTNSSSSRTFSSLSNQVRLGTATCPLVIMKSVSTARTGSLYSSRHGSCRSY